jgi:Uma2 family endonuclease
MTSAALKLNLDAPPATVADLLHRLGDIPAERILMKPPPGTAEEQDVIDLLHGANKRICELVDGVLVEKPMGFREGFLALVVGHLLLQFLEEHDLGLPGGPDSPVRLRLGLVRLPDVCFVSWDRLGGDELPEDAISKVIPELAIEILSKSNTPREIELKLQEYFQAGVLLVWVIDPRKQTAESYTSPTRKKQAAKDGVLDGGKVLPGFKLSLKELFARATRRRGRK